MKKLETVINDLKRSLEHLKQYPCTGGVITMPPQDAQTLLNAIEERWIPVTERLPELVNTMGCGNKYSNDVLITDGETSVVAYLEAVRPTFEKKVWTMPLDDDLTMQDYTGKEATHWMPLPTPPKG